MTRTARTSTTSTAAMSVDTIALQSVALFKGRAETEIDDDALARLVRSRLRLSRGLGWALFSTFAATFGLSLVLTATMRTSLLLGAGIALMGSVAFGLGFLVERSAWTLFARQGRQEGLSVDACARIYARAPDAESFIQGLASCGRAPSDADLARFVCPERAGIVLSSFNRTV